MKKLILAACLVFSALAMTACGPGDDTGDAGTDAGESSDAGDA
jgi:hypothetical protein